VPLVPLVPWWGGARLSCSWLVARRASMSHPTAARRPVSNVHPDEARWGNRTSVCHRPDPHCFGTRSLAVRHITARPIAIFFLLHHSPRCIVQPHIVVPRSQTSHIDRRAYCVEPSWRLSGSSLTAKRKSTTKNKTKTQNHVPRPGSVIPHPRAPAHPIRSRTQPARQCPRSLHCWPRACL
jgi:hypothetical protein